MASLHRPVQYPLNKPIQSQTILNETKKAKETNCAVKEAKVTGTQFTI